MRNSFIGFQIGTLHICYNTTSFLIAQHPDSISKPLFLRSFISRVSSLLYTMAGVIIENLSGYKLLALVVMLMLLQLSCFLIGGLIAPAPMNPEMTLGSRCIDDNSSWYYIRGEGRCAPIPVQGSFDTPSIEHNTVNKDDRTHQQMANKLVFVFQIPLPRDNRELDYSRWQQNLIGVLQFEILHLTDANTMPEEVTLTLDVKLGYRNKGDDDKDWKLVSENRVERQLICSRDEREHEHYQCSIVPLFELGSLHHDYYLLNVRIPVDEKKQMNTNLGYLADLWLVAINQNGGFTITWMMVKIAFFPMVILIECWSWNRVKKLNRKPVLLEYMLLYLGLAMTFLNTPVELLTLYFDMPYMPLFQDIRQGVFYAVLLSFWLVFAGEHLIIQDPQPHHLRMYWKHLSAVGIGCVSLLLFDLIEKGPLLLDPFYSIWVTPWGSNLALTFIICAGMSASIYFIFLCYMIFKVFRTVNIKRSALPSMSSLRRLHYEGIMYRFKFLMLATLACAAVTIIGFILDQASEGKWVWDETIEIEYTSAFLTGSYGMWNIYILALLVFYAPSHKQWPSDVDLNSPAADEIELSHISATEPNEISLLTSFVKKMAAD